MTLLSLIYLVQANTVQRTRDVRPVFGLMLGQRSERWASIGPALGWCPVFAGRVSTLCWFSVGPCLRRCPGTAPTLGRSWCLLGFTILCNNVDFWLFRSAYMFFFYYIHIGVTYKPKWVLYCKHIYIVIGSVCTCHYNKNIQYNTINEDQTNSLLPELGSCWYGANWEEELQKCVNCHFLMRSKKF